MKIILSKNGYILIAVMISSIFLITACASTMMGTPEETLRQRVDGLMTAKINDDWDVFYSYLDSAYRKKTPEKSFLRLNRETSFTSYNIESVDILPSGDEADVIVTYDMTVKIFDFKDQVETQRWVREGRNWYMKMGK